MMNYSLEFANVEAVSCGLWQRDEKIDYCDNYSALISEKKSNKLLSVISAIFALLVK